MRIINLTQHSSTPEQGVIDLLDEEKSYLVKLLTFTSIPTSEDILNRAIALADMAHFNGATHAMVGGAPYLMSTLEKVLKEMGIIPLYAFSERVSEEVTNPDGSVTKVNVFKHMGFVKA